MKNYASTRSKRRKARHRRKRARRHATCRRTRKLDHDTRTKGLVAIIDEAIDLLPVALRKMLRPNG